ncbi:hypothetical protein PZA11_007442 [Diplocarpon coronariae]|uniref:FAD-binding PCMH-type domain-containing protein n=1 Tax=Diplocarpon coronariae TaxID=2795749 RepID=A0A218Z6B6_9HELO|nr:hypothetical protein JHW43_004489 [Diplocarpon mali]OWP03073.1 hypothetical protein B2J93_6390 [Marssonina coronariae]
MLGTTLVLLASSALVAAAPYATNQTRESCNFLFRHYPESVHFPGSLRYAREDTFSWSTDSWLGPACVFTPYSTPMVTAGIQLLAARDVPFAIRGGGFMPIANAANIGPEGILFSNSNMTLLTIEDDKSVVHVGAGVTFGPLYDFVAPHNVAINGVRLGNVGVVGFHLGGGIGFFSYEHGVAPTTVKSFDVVLANGTATTVSNSSSADLFWALRGGGNNFAYVTSVSLYTIPSESIVLGDVGYGTERADQYYESMTDFALHAGADPASSTEGQSRWQPARNPNVSYHAFLFNSANKFDAPGFANLTAPKLPFTSGNLTKTTMSGWFKRFEAHPDFDNRKRFLFYSIPADKAAFKIATDAYYRVLREEKLDEVRGFFTAFSVMPITSKVVEASAANGGNPTGLTASSVPALWLVESPSWDDGVDDAHVDAAHVKANAAIKDDLKAAGFDMLPFIYLSDAALDQPVFEGYGQESWDKLKSIAKIYDPTEVFQRLVPGAPKISADRGQARRG